MAHLIFKAVFFLVSFSDEEKYQLRKFVNKSYLLDKTAHRQVYYSLVDILLAYCYEVRVTEGDHNVSLCVCHCGRPLC